MSEPTRWKDAPNAPIGMKELLRSAKPSRAMDEATFMRNADKVAKIAIAPAAAAAISVWAKLAAAGAVIGLATVGTVAVWKSTPPTEAIVVSATHASATSPPFQQNVAPPTPVATEEEPAPVASSAPVVPAPMRVAAPPPAAAAPKPVETAPPAEASSAAVWTPEEPPRAASTLKDELSLLESAKHDLARSPESSLQKLAAHRARYPSGVMAAERDLMELDALRRTGRIQEARDRARTWLARDPQGIHSARVRQILSTLE
jgi:hypothetical protein